MKNSYYINQDVCVAEGLMGKKYVYNEIKFFPLGLLGIIISIFP